MTRLRTTFPKLSTAISLLASDLCPSHDHRDDDILICHAIMAAQSVFPVGTLNLCEQAIQSLNEDEIERLVTCPDSTPTVNRLMLWMYDRLLLEEQESSPSGCA